MLVPDRTARSRRSRQILATAASAALAVWLAPRQASAALTPNANNTLTASDTTGTISILTLTFNPPPGDPNFAGAINLTQTAGTSLNFSAGGIVKNGLFTSLISGGSITSSNDPSEPDLAVTVNGTGELTIASALSGADLSLTKSGTGTLELTNTNAALNTIGYGLILNQGTVRISSDANLGANVGNAADIYFQGGTLEIKNGDVNLSAGRQVNFNSGGGTLRVVNSVGPAVTRVLTIDETNQIAGTGALNKTGDGVLRVSSANSYAGNVNVQGGTLELRNANALAVSPSSRSKITVGSGATLSLRADGATPGAEVVFGNDVVIPNNASAAVIEVGRVVDTTQTNFKLGKLDIGTLGTGTDLVTDTRLVIQQAVVGATDRSLEFTGTTTVNGDVEVQNTVDVRLGGALTGNGSLTKTGGGRLSISGIDANTYANVTRVQGGTLELSKSPGVNAIPGDLEITGGTVILTTPNQINNDNKVTINAGGELDLQGNDENISTLDNANGLLETGAGTLTVTSPNTSFLRVGSTTSIDNLGSIDTAHLVIEGGANTVRAGGVMNIGANGLDFLPTTTSNPTVVLNSGAAAAGKLVLQGDVTVPYVLTAGNPRSTGTAFIALGSGPIPTAGTLDLGNGTRNFTVGDGGNAVDMEISASITNGTLQKSGAGVLRLTGNNTHSGGTILSAGVLEAASANALGTGLAGGPVSFRGGKLRLVADVPAGGTLNFGRDLASGSGGSVSIELARANGSGAIGTFQVGALSIGPAFSVSPPQGGINSGGTLLATGPVTLSGSGSNPSVITTDLDVTLNGAVGGNATFTKAGAGTLTLGGSASNTYVGTTTVNNGTVGLNKTGGATAIPGNVSVNGGSPVGVANVRLLASDQIANSSTVNLVSTLATLDLSGNAETVAAVTGAGRVTLGTGGALTIKPAVAGATSFTGVVSGAGRVIADTASFGGVTLSGSNTFTGGAGVTTGSISVTFNPTGGPYSSTTLVSGNWDVGPGASLTIPSVNFTTIGPAASVLLNGPGSSFSPLSVESNFTANQGTFGITGGRNFTVGAFNNTGTLNVGGSGNSTFTAASVAQLSGNTLNGGTWNALANGTLKINNATSITTIGPAAALRLAGGAQVVNSSSTSVVDAINNNQGSLSLTDGRTFSTASNFSNAGVLTVGSGAGNSSFSVTGAGITAQLSGSVLGGGTFRALANGTISLNGANITTIGPSAGVTLGGANATFNQINTVATNLGRFEVSGGRAFTTVGALTNSGTLVAGAGSVLTVNGTLSGIGVIDVSGTLRSQAGVLTPIEVGTLTVAATGRVDVNDGGIVKRNGGSGAAGQAATRALTALAKLGLENGGAFDLRGPGISSTEAFNDNTAAGSVLYGVGVIQNNLAAAGAPDGTTTDATAGNTIYTTFRGRTVGLNDTLVRYTYMGDADLSGAIDGTDYSLIDAAFGAGLNGWLNGDFDHSGAIDGTDYALIDNAFGVQTGPLSEQFLARYNRSVSTFGQSYIDALSLVQSGVVPEPVCLGVLAFAGVGVAATQRRRRRD